MRLVVVGGGVIGLSCAWRAAQAGHDVTVVDPAPASGASWVAGGMLAPLTEACPGEERLLTLGAEAVERWPSFAAELEKATGLRVGLRTEGTLVVATGLGDRAELGVLADHLAALGRAVERLTGRELRRLEPGLGPDVRSGVSVPSDLAVDNRLLLAALRSVLGPACFVTATAQEVLGQERVTGVRTDRVGDVSADAVLIAAGAHAAGLHPALTGLVRPVKGEIVRLRHRAGGLPPPSRTVRALVDGRPVYLVPRDGGGLVVGATQYESGPDDTEPTVDGVRHLLRDAERILPGIAEYALVEAAAGLRPGSPDNRPLVGRTGTPGLFVATGHSRNGMLLAPTTAAAVCSLLAGGPDDPATDPRRFERSPVCA